MMTRLDCTVQLLLLLATAMADDSIKETASVVVPASTLSSADDPRLDNIGAHPPGDDVQDSGVRLDSHPAHFEELFEMDSICDDAMPLLAPSIGNPVLLQGRTTGHYVLPRCSNYVPDRGEPAAAYKLTGTGDVLEATTFQGRAGSNEPRTSPLLSVYRGCVKREHHLSADQETDSSNDRSVDSSTGSGCDNQGEPKTNVDAGKKQCSVVSPREFDPRCVDGQFHSQARWKTEPGKEYTVIVHGSNSAQPLEFVLSVAAFPPLYLCDNTVQSQTITPDNLGQVSLKDNKSISRVGTTHGGPIVSDMPTCDFSSAAATAATSLSPAALYEVEVVDPNVRVKVSLQGEGQVSIYQGGCKVGGAICGPTCDHNGICPFPLWMGNGRMPSCPGNVPPYMRDRSFQKLSWHNQDPGSQYLIAVNKCCGSQAMGDHLLSISVSTYGNVCKDVSEANMVNFTDETSLADKKIFPGLIPCHDDDSPQLTPTAFYRLTGTGDRLLATITYNDDGKEVEDLTVRLSLYTVKSCHDSAPACLASKSYNGPLLSPTVKGETYYLAVFSSSGVYSEKLFTLNIKSVPYKDLASATIDVGVISSAKSVEIRNTTTGGSVITNLDACKYGAIQSPALAYSFKTGEAGQLTAEAGSHWIIDLALLEGSCDQSACRNEQLISYCDDSYGTHKHLSQHVEAEKTYFVVVFGTGRTGLFHLSLRISKVDDPCANAVVIDNLTDGLEIHGSTKNASKYQFNNSQCSPRANIPSVVYALKTDGDKWITVSVQSNQISPNVYVLENSASEGECSGQFSCTDMSSFSITWSWKAIAGTRYYVVVYGDSERIGDFKVQFHVKEKEDVCKNVADLGIAKEEGLIFSVPMYESTKFYDLVNCGDDEVAPSSSALYSFTAGVTGEMAVMAEFVTSSDIMISAYTGSCDNLACVDMYPFHVQEGAVYYLVINQWNIYGYDSNGRFVLAVLEPKKESNVIPINSLTGDVCSDVEDLGSITENGLLLTGTTTNMPFCPQLVTCDDRPTSSGVKLYKIATPSQGAVSVAVVGIDVCVSVYQGMCDSELVCGPGHARRMVYFDVGPNSVYYVVVFGSNRSSGNFFLHIALTPTGSLCNDSIPLESISMMGLSLIGSTENGRLYNNLPSCKGVVQTNSPVLSYSVVGTGGMITASVSPNKDLRVPFRPELAVYSKDCGSPQCVDFIPGHNRVTWPSFLNASYFLEITGCCDSQSTVEFELTLKVMEIADLCTEAIALGTPLAYGVTTTKSHHGGRYFPALLNCSSDDFSRSVTIHSVVGTGDVFRAEVSAGSGISVVFGGCSSVTCIGGSYNYDNSQVWATEPNVTYFIAVFGDPPGNYTLTVKPISTCSTCDGDGVTNLGKIADGGLVLHGSTVNGPIFRGLSPCVNNYSTNDDSRGMWTPSAAFKFTGDGDTYLFFVEKVTGFMDAQIHGYKGDCSDMECISVTADGRSMVLTTEVNKTYTVIVNDRSRNQSGTFELRIVSAVLGDLKMDAIDITIPESGLFLIGSTLNGKIYDLRPCHNAIWGPGVSYRVDTGIGSWTASVTGFSIDAIISVYTVDDKGGFVCLGLQHDMKHVSWTSDNPNQVVYFVIFGSDLSSGGDYALRVRNFSRVSNMYDSIVDLGLVGDKGVLRIESNLRGFSAINVSNYPCRNDQPSASNWDYPNDYPRDVVQAALYKLHGTGAQITASVFLPSTGGADVSIMALTGNNGASECIADVKSYSPRSVSWTGEVGQAYFIMVMMRCCSEVTFVLTVHESRIPPVSDQLASQS